MLYQKNSQCPSFRRIITFCRWNTKNNMIVSNGNTVCILATMEKGSWILMRVVRDHGQVICPESRDLEQKIYNSKCAIFDKAFGWW